jgi:hypothetical protein
LTGSAVQRNQDLQDSVGRRDAGNACFHAQSRPATLRIAERACSAMSLARW